MDSKPPLLETLTQQRPQSIPTVSISSSTSNPNQHYSQSQRPVPSETSNAISKRIHITLTLDPPSRPSHESTATPPSPSTASSSTPSRSDTSNPNSMSPRQGHVSSRSDRTSWGTHPTRRQTPSLSPLLASAALNGPTKRHHIVEYVVEDPPRLPGFPYNQHDGGDEMGGESGGDAGASSDDGMDRGSLPDYHPPPFNLKIVREGVISGTVNVTVLEPCPDLRSILISLTGTLHVDTTGVTSKLHAFQSAAEVSGNMVEVQPIRRKFLHEQVLLFWRGLRELGMTDEGQSKTLAIGRHSFPFKLSITQPIPATSTIAGSNNWSFSVRYALQGSARFSEMHTVGQEIALTTPNIFLTIVRAHERKRTRRGLESSADDIGGAVVDVEETDDVESPVVEEGERVEPATPIDEEVENDGSPLKSGKVPSLTTISTVSDSDPSSPTPPSETDIPTDIFIPIPGAPSKIKSSNQNINVDEMPELGLPPAYFCHEAGDSSLLDRVPAPSASPLTAPQPSPAMNIKTGISEDGLLAWEIKYPKVVWLRGSKSFVPVELKLLALMADEDERTRQFGGVVKLGKVLATLKQRTEFRLNAKVTSKKNNHVTWLSETVGDVVDVSKQSVIPSTNDDIPEPNTYKTYHLQYQLPLPNGLSKPLSSKQRQQNLLTKRKSIDIFSIPSFSNSSLKIPLQVPGKRRSLSILTRNTNLQASRSVETAVESEDDASDEEEWSEVAMRVSHHVLIQPTLRIGTPACEVQFPTSRLARRLEVPPAPTAPPPTQPTSPSSDSSTATAPQETTADSTAWERLSRPYLLAVEPGVHGIGLGDIVLPLESTTAAAPIETLEGLRLSQMRSRVEGDGEDVDIARSHSVSFRIPYKSARPCDRAPKDTVAGTSQERPLSNFFAILGGANGGLEGLFERNKRGSKLYGGRASNSNLIQKGEGFGTFHLPNSSSVLELDFGIAVALASGNQFVKVVDLETNFCVVQISISHKGRDSFPSHPASHLKGEVVDCCDIMTNRSTSPNANALDGHEAAVPGHDADSSPTRQTARQAVRSMSTPVATNSARSRSPEKVPFHILQASASMPAATTDLVIPAEPVSSRPATSNNPMVANPLPLTAHIPIGSSSSNSSPSSRAVQRSIWRQVSSGNLAPFGSFLSSSATPFAHHSTSSRREIRVALDETDVEIVVKGPLIPPSVAWLPDYEDPMHVHRGDELPDYVVPPKEVVESGFITGNITLKLEQPLTNVKLISVRVIGLLEVDTFAIVNSRVGSDAEPILRKVLAREMVVFRPTEGTSIAPGEHMYNFVCEVPGGCPPTTIVPFLTIKYSVDAVLLFQDKSYMVSPTEAFNVIRVRQIDPPPGIESEAAAPSAPTVAAELAAPAVAAPAAPAVVIAEPESSSTSSPRRAHTELAPRHPDEIPPVIFPKASTLIPTPSIHSIRKSRSRASSFVMRPNSRQEPHPDDSDNPQGRSRSMSPFRAEQQQGSVMDIPEVPAIPEGFRAEHADVSTTEAEEGETEAEAVADKPIGFEEGTSVLVAAVAPAAEASSGPEDVQHDMPESVENQASAVLPSDVPPKVSEVVSPHSNSETSSAPHSVASSSSSAHSVHTASETSSHRIGERFLPDAPASEPTTAFPNDPPAEPHVPHRATFSGVTEDGVIAWEASLLPVLPSHAKEVKVDLVLRVLRIDTDYECGARKLDPISVFVREITMFRIVMLSKVNRGRFPKKIPEERVRGKVIAKTNFAEMEPSDDMPAAEDIKLHLTIPITSVGTSILSQGAQYNQQNAIFSSHTGNPVNLLPDLSDKDVDRYHHVRISVPYVLRRRPDASMSDWYQGPRRNKVCDISLPFKVVLLAKGCSFPWEPLPQLHRISSQALPQARARPAASAPQSNTRLGFPALSRSRSSLVLGSNDSESRTASRSRSASQAPPPSETASMLNERNGAAPSYSLEDPALGHVSLRRTISHQPSNRGRTVFQGHENQDVDSAPVLPEIHIEEVSLSPPSPSTFRPVAVGARG
ncbi:hypothetical protein HDU97_007125 [Phlyctochytrium planicorne]|nr:hypothetical protein HDU97_007125 [Phlyctochytrium planicorne]